MHTETLLSLCPLQVNSKCHDRSVEGRSRQAEGGAEALRVLHSSESREGGAAHDTFWSRCGEKPNSAKLLSNPSPHSCTSTVRQEHGTLPRLPGNPVLGHVSSAQRTAYSTVCASSNAGKLFLLLLRERQVDSNRAEHFFLLGSLA